MWKPDEGEISELYAVILGFYYWDGSGEKNTTENTDFLYLFEWRNLEFNQLIGAEIVNYGRAPVDKKCKKGNCPVREWINGRNLMARFEDGRLLFESILEDGKSIISRWDSERRIYEPNMMY